MERDDDRPARARDQAGTLEWRLQTNPIARLLLERLPELDPGSGGRIAVELASGYPEAQVFAPPGEAHVCLEPMTAPVNALVAAPRSLRWVRPDRRHVATFRIAVGVDASG